MLADERSAVEEQYERMIREAIDTGDPVGALDSEIESGLATLVAQLDRHRPERVVELARIACLPWQVGGLVKPDTDGGLTKAELLALLALTVAGGIDIGSARAEPTNSLYVEAHGWVSAVGDLIHRSSALRALQAQNDPLARITASVGGREVWVRNSSYPDMVSRTHGLLLDTPSVAGFLKRTLGFEAREAASVLTALNEVQMSSTNERSEGFIAALGARPTFLAGVNELVLTSEEKVAFNEFWQPTADLVVFSASDIDAVARCGEETTRAVLNHFSVSSARRSAREILNAFAAGDNPLRTHPVIRTAEGRYILVHEALVLPAVRENLELTIRSSPEWERYQKHRGDVLEDIGRIAFELMLPGATTYFAFDYFIPADEAEELLPPSKYTKRVEGDMLFIVDDVAVIVEAKAVSITPDARAGVPGKLRRNLTDMISRAATQASRLKKRIERDGGVRLKSDEWLDLSRVLEVHMVALTLEDLTQVATATTALVDAGLLNAGEVPWLVSIHDLQIIAQLVERPADFLLYLRRRRDPEMPDFYFAVDELDLFLYYLDAGLYVAPDPKVMAAELPYASETDEHDRRRREEQQQVFIHPRTGPLDTWHQSQIDPQAPSSPKPRRTARPMDRFVDELASRRDFGWLSIGATLLSGDGPTQRHWARIARKMLAQPRKDGQGQSRFEDAGNTQAEAWAFVWATQPRHQTREDTVARAAKYLRDKKYQTTVARGAAFIFDERTKNLIDVIYDGEVLPRSEEMDEQTRYLFPLPVH
ncbi:hypothetical protein [Microbacterium sp. CCH5-D1]|uniref:hypothetical protein n=1 Tax=Microbacterium sp. CCH5-D1 TaxID=1768780 RepID=UPI000769B9B6|nr:hypothetical protein [Microbacterium sp. CCH5-D1]